MKLLYLSCHSVLEYDEVKLFTELGIDVFSHGVYSNPQKPGDPKRPPIDATFHPDLYYLALRHGKEDLPQEMIAWADVIVCMHIVDWLTLNWEKMGNKRVIWRSIGQSTENVESLLSPLRDHGLDIVRYSPREKTIPGFVGQDAMIRFYKDPDEFKDWTGEDKQVITIGQSMKQRSDFCNYPVFEAATRGLPRKLLGSENAKEVDIDGGPLSYDELKAVLRASRAYFYTGTYPAPYTLNFIEALMTGTPIVALGPRFGNSPYEQGQSTYEVADFFDTSGGGLYADSIDELNKYVKLLLDDWDFARKISARARTFAIDNFAKDKIKQQWKEFLNV